MDTIRKTLRLIYTQVSLFFASEIEHSESEMMCTICLDEFNQTQAYTKFACGHAFHFECDVCPNCRAIIHEVPPREFIGLSNRSGNLHPGGGSYNVVPQPEVFPNIPRSFPDVTYSDTHSKPPADSNNNTEEASPASELRDGFLLIAPMFQICGSRGDHVDYGCLSPPTAETAQPPTYEVATANTQPLIEGGNNTNLQVSTDGGNIAEQ
ncbi:8355_t:CDS:2, partial [Funneliformis caledonium]